MLGGGRQLGNRVFPLVQTRPSEGVLSSSRVEFSADEEEVEGGDEAEEGQEESGEGAEGEG